MALEPKKKGGLFAGLANLSNDDAPDKKDPEKQEKAVGKTPEKKADSTKSSSTIASNQASSTRKPSESTKATLEAAPTAEPTQPEPQRVLSQPAAQPVSAVAAQPEMPIVEPQQFNGLPYNSFEAQAQSYQQGSMVRTRAQLIDGRYKRNPKSFRTCIALTEELHQNVERAKQSGRISSLNDLINNLLTDYFKLN